MRGGRSIEAYIHIDIGWIAEDRKKRGTTDVMAGTHTDARDGGAGERHLLRRI